MAVWPCGCVVWLWRGSVRLLTLEAHQNGCGSDSFASLALVLASFDGNENHAVIRGKKENTGRQAAGPRNAVMNKGCLSPYNLHTIRTLSTLSPWMGKWCQCESPLRRWCRGLMSCFRFL